MRACYQGVALAIYFDAAKHCNVKQIYLRTSNSIPMELMERSTERINDEEEEVEEEEGKKKSKWRPHYFN